MKKRVTLCIFLMLVLAISIYFVADQYIVETKNLDGGMMTSYENYEERLNGSDLVVIAKLVNEPLNVLTPYGGGFPDGHHVSKIKISNVIKGNNEHDQMIIDVREPYYTMEKGILPGKYEVFYGDYTKMEQGNTYLLFLGWTEEWGQYGIASAHEGKFNLDGEDQVEQKMIQGNEKLQRLRNDIFNQQEVSEFIE
ncbi:hypothetical protein [Solibacillus sp. FSL K6-1523]|uniref:hypothetical protein n=1 Tax=Solibacillus sp. FSL K6-1523 TaxID=2921471 RepID=UPI0030F9DF71